MTMPTTHIATQQHDANRRAAIRWGAFVVGLLSLQVAGGAFAIFLATSDESVAVVPNYHQQALNWDQHVALRNASTKLGWNAAMSQFDGETGVAGLRIHLRNRDGGPVEIESGEIEIYRHARAGAVRRVAIPAGAADSIDLGQCFDTSGLWQVAIDVTDSDGNRFLDSQEMYVVVPSGDGVPKGTR
jgi:hypothetical protein